MSWSLTGDLRVATMLLMWIGLIIFPLAAAQNHSVDFSSAVVQEASVQPEQLLGNLSNPVPLPPSVEGVPNYDSILKLAAAMPPLPVTIGKPSVGEIKSDIIPHASNNDADTENFSGRLNARQDALRVLVVGDSMTHCNEGDFTWRYRLLEWFNAQNIAIRYVGPYAGTIAPPAPGPPQKPALYRESPTASSANTDGGYNLGIKSLGDLRHFAMSGRAAATDQHLIEQVARDYPADLILIKLGFIDLGWFYSDDKGLITNMRNLINNARRARPNMRFVVATVVHRTFIRGREDLVTMTDSYNRMLKAQIREWSTPSSPVTWAPVREEYDCGPKYPQDCPAAHDGLHPNELGEYQIARGFSRALVSGLGIGKTPLEVPGTIPSRSLPTPGNFQMSSSDLGVTATWDKVYGAYSYDVEYIINGGAPYSSPGSVESNRWDSRWAAEGWTYEVRIRASAGIRKGPWTTWYSATAHPHTASAPTNVVTRPTASGIDVSWTGSTGLYSDTVSQYNVYFWDQDQPCAFLLSGGFLPGGSASIIDLVPGHRYLVAIEAWNAAGAGFPLVARRVVPGRGQPPTVSGLQVDTVDPTTAHLTWNTIPDAAGYRYWRRNFNQAGSQLVPLYSIDETCINVYFQLPGTWNYEWAVTAYNGEIESTISLAVKAPPQNSPSVTGTCPGLPALCPPGSGGVPSTDPVDPSNPPPVGGGGSSEPGEPNPDDPNGPNPDDPDDDDDDNDDGHSDCQGPDCDNGSCRGPRCCKGRGCGSNGSCVGFFCIEGPCSGPDCDGKGCKGLRCCSGRDCSEGICIGPRCYKGPCSGPNCSDGVVCNGPFCCFGPECKDGKCLGPKCTSGEEQNEKDCGEPKTVSICTETVTSISATTTTFTHCDKITACDAQAATKTVTEDCQCTACVDDSDSDPFFIYGDQGPVFRDPLVYPTDYIVVVAGTTIIPESPSEPTSGPPDPAPPTIPLCIASSTESTPGGFPVYNYVAFFPGDNCKKSVNIADPNIESPPAFCSIPREETVLDYCGAKGRFVNEGQKFRDTGCALSVEINGRVYSDYDVPKEGEEQDFCRCTGTTWTGLLMFKALPSC